jgi:phosphotransferase system enzyme I (PtsI)
MLLSKPEGTKHEMRILSGVPACRGFASGEVFLLLRSDTAQVREFQVADTEAECERLKKAFAATREQIRALADALGRQIRGSEASILDGHIMMLDDPSFYGACADEICKRKINADAAVKCVAERYSRIFVQMDDKYLKERAKDIGDVTKRLLSCLAGMNAPVLSFDHPCIIVADELTPSETISLPQGKILGFATDRGSLTSHASLLARALGIPAVVGLKNITECVKNGDFLLLDGTRGKVIMNPGMAEKQAFVEMKNKSRQFEAALAEGRHLPGVTADGHAIPVLANIDSSTPLAGLAEAGAEGVGLYRSEYLWLAYNRTPTEEEQTEAYSKIVRGVPSGQAVTIRVLDLGGDKVTRKDESGPREANPFLGERSIRFLLRNPEMFRSQLRAILRASAYGNVQLMYPMVATIEELEAANQELEVCKAELSREGIAFNPKIRRGVMIEIPSAALVADALAAESEFFSIGTNDLVQYTLAVDRLNERVAHLYQPTHPGVLKLIAMAVRAVHARGHRVSVCGEAAADPYLAVLLIGLGVDALSMSPNMIPLVKRVLRCVKLTDAQALAERVMTEMTSLPAAKIYTNCCAQILHLVPDLLYIG